MRRIIGLGLVTFLAALVLGPLAWADGSGYLQFNTSPANVVRYTPQMAAMTPAQKDGFCRFDTSVRAFQMETSLANDGYSRWGILDAVNMFTYSFMWKVQMQRDGLTPQEYQDIIKRITSGVWKDTHTDAYYCRRAMSVSFLSMGPYGEMMYRRRGFKEFMDHTDLANIDTDPRVYLTAGALAPSTFDDIRAESYQTQ